MERISDEKLGYLVTSFEEEETTQNDEFASGIQSALYELMEYRRAKAAGRLVELPCNVGDTVYLIIRGHVEKTRVRTFFVGHPSYNRGEPDPKYEMIRCENFDVPIKDFGKTVFLTLESAEAALEAQEGQK